jgi:2'-5' RNA ligase
MRLFVAADLPPDVRRWLGEIQGGLRHRAPEIRWVRPEAIHLTFKFLGEVDATRRESIEAALRPAIEALTPFTLQAAGVGAFPEGGAPRIIWVGLAGDLDSASRLWEGIEAAMELCGFERERRPFTPHLTIGRIREGRRPGDWQTAVPAAVGTTAGGFTLTECVLFRSHLDPGGARYEPLARFPLRGGAAR